MAANPPTPIGVIAASVPPAIITSASQAGDDLESVSNGMCAGGTRRTGGLVRPPGVVADADMAGSQVDDRGGNEKRRDLARPTIQQADMLALDHVESADCQIRCGRPRVQKSQA